MYSPKNQTLLKIEDHSDTTSETTGLKSETQQGSGVPKITTNIGSPRTSSDSGTAGTPRDQIRQRRHERCKGRADEWARICASRLTSAHQSPQLLTRRGVARGRSGQRGCDRRWALAIGLASVIGLYKCVRSSSPTTAKQRKVFQKQCSIETPAKLRSYRTCRSHV